MEKVSESIAKSEPLFCLGYHLPDIQITGQFTKPVYFSKTEFQRADFSEVSFNDKANFYGATFLEANFSRVSFLHEANFYGVNFTGRTNFLEAAFRWKTDFSISTFSGITNFSRTVFDYYTYFNGSKFFDETDFSETIFHGNVSFSSAKFNKAASFTKARFNQAAFFTESRFNQADFYLTKFKLADFTHSMLQEADFSKTEFSGEISFRSALFENEPKIFFDGDLSKVSFLDANITGVRFGDNVSWGGKDNFRVLDEERLNQLHEKLGAVVRIYRRLRRNYENSDRYEEADRFYIREMELQREYREVI